jgi:hypothetical protein
MELLWSLPLHRGSRTATAPRLKFCVLRQAPSNQAKANAQGGFLKVQWPIKLVLKNGRHVTYEP